MSRGPRSAPPELPGFTPDRWIGGGGFADVFLYTQLRPSRSVAIKILRREHLSAQALEQFDAEADIMAEVSTHPYIVTIFSSGVSPDGRPYIVMEHYPRPNFGDRAKGGSLDLAEVLRTGIQVASAVETAHRAGIIHRDIKPANILTSAFGRPGLTDFGISGVQTEGRISEAVGITVAYTAPELLSEESAGSAATDVYGLAATVWALAAGHSPFWSSTGDNGGQAILARALAGDVTALTRAGIPNSLKHLLTQAMDGNPAHRPSSALAFAQALQQIEQELRLQPTPIEVAPGAEKTGRADLDDSNEEERTRRGIQVVDPQPSPATRPPRDPSRSGHGGDPRPGAGGLPIVASSTPPGTTSGTPATGFSTPAATPSMRAPGPASGSPAAASRVPSISTTPSWARSTPHIDDSETVARRRPGTDAPSGAAATPVFVPAEIPDVERSEVASSTAPATSDVSIAAASAGRRTREVPWSRIGIGAGMLAAFAMLVLVLTSVTGRSSKAGPGSATTLAGPIQSIKTTPDAGPVSTPADATIGAFRVTGSTATAPAYWTPDPEDPISVAVEAVPFGGGTPAESFDAPADGTVPITLHLGAGGSCTSATVGPRTLPCEKGPPCLRITGYALDRPTGTPTIVQYPAAEADSTILRTPTIHLTAAQYVGTCQTSFEESP